MLKMLLKAVSISVFIKWENMNTNRTHDITVSCLVIRSSYQRQTDTLLVVVLQIKQQNASFVSALQNDMWKRFLI